MNADFKLGTMWEKEDTLIWLNDTLKDAQWHQRLIWEDRMRVTRPACPQHPRLKGGYGKWLAECPDFPGLFELIHRLIVNWEGGARLPQPEEILCELERIARERAGQGTLF